VVVREVVLVAELEVVAAAEQVEPVVALEGPVVRVERWRWRQRRGEGNAGGTTGGTRGTGGANNYNNPYANPLNNPYNQSRTIVPQFPPSAATNQQILAALADGTGGFSISTPTIYLAASRRLGASRASFISWDMCRQKLPKEVATP